jgi:dipeptidyl aminopeptidase/acylaminoacyl peptidase
MRQAVFLLGALLAGLPVSAGAQAAAQAPPAAAQTSHAADARVFVNTLIRQDYPAIIATFDETMLKAMPEAKLREFWTALSAQVGAFQRVENQRVDRVGAYEAVVITVAFANATANITVVYDTKGKVAGFNIRPAQQPSAPPSYADTKAFTEREVTVGSGEWALPGTLSMPAGAGPFPAVVIVHGSGPGDRDGTQGANKPYRDLAHGLASRGIAVLRYDKRSRVHGQKMMSRPRPTVKEESVDDAALAVDLLAATSSIARDRIFVLGHSLGAMLVPRIAAAAPNARGFVVMAGPARPLEQAMYEQAQYMAAIDGQTTPAEQASIDEMKKVFDAVRALKPSDIDAPTRVAGVPASYWLDLRGYDPPEAAKAVAKPMLVLQGERDYQVTPAEFARWNTALGSRPDVVLKIYPALNHQFIAGTGPAGPQDYSVAGHVSEEVVRDIAAWILKAGG